MRYRAVIVRSGNGWAIDVPDVRGVHSQARRIDQVPAQAADALSLALDRHVSPDDIDVDVHAGELDDVIATAVEARQLAERARGDASAAMREAVTRALAAGLPLRDVGRLLGVSHQRAAAIARDVAA